ncbi:unnamed protein product [Moneuplotes crassus]|uniref:BZIP domain-containing protein n=1 Tax=Euplotes crassus TaxID=5936 RepID=A0AAD1XHV5_EUPCR|nr:unnamed protein product [Moneuplotes crassus]
MDNDCQKESEPKSSKQRSKEYRERKKGYLKQLETRIERLECEIIDLRSQNERLIKEVEMSKEEKKEMNLEEKLKFHEDYLHNSVLKELRHHPENIRFTMISQHTISVSEYSDLRINFIKELFRKILENMNSLSVKASYACMKNLSKREVNATVSGKRRYKFINKKVKHAKDYLFDYKFSDDAVKYFCKEDHPVKIICRKVKKLNQQLIKLRNKIINTFYMLRSCQEEGQSMLNYTKEDIAKFGLLVQKLKSTKFLSPHYLWDIPKKDHEKECYDSGELTE